MFKHGRLIHIPSVNEEENAAHNVSDLRTAILDPHQPGHHYINPILIIDTNVLQGSALFDGDSEAGFLPKSTLIKAPRISVSWVEQERLLRVTSEAPTTKILKGSYSFDSANFARLTRRKKSLQMVNIEQGQGILLWDRGIALAFIGLAQLGSRGSVNQLNKVAVISPNLNLYERH